jgi:hypothetical protein
MGSRFSVRMTRRHGSGSSATGNSAGRLKNSLLPALENRVCFGSPGDFASVASISTNLPASTNSHAALRPVFSCQRGTAELVDLICPTGQAKYFFAQDWTTQISLNRLKNLDFTRTRFLVLSTGRPLACFGRVPRTWLRLSRQRTLPMKALSMELFSSMRIG